MARYDVTLTASTSNLTSGVYVCTVNKNREYWVWFATLWAQGTFGSGTLTWYATIDGGTTLVPIKDITDAAISMTTNSAVNIQLGNGQTNTNHPQIWVKLAGATTPNLLVSVLDNK